MSDPIEELKTHQDACKYVSTQPILLSLLYDLDLSPEQLDWDKPNQDNRKMLLIVTHWFRNEQRHKK